jgi:cytochrome c oxidase subunit 2
MGIWPKGFPLFPNRATELAREIDRLYFAGLGIAAFFSLLIAVLVFALAIRYRRRHADEVGQREQAPTWLEIVWSVVPFVILMAMFTWGTRIYFEARRPPAGALEYYVTAKQWMWKFQHPEGNREINHLHVPKGVPIKLIMTSEDVIHSFFVPEFRVKMDVLPGRYTTLWFNADTAGTYRLFCNEYCGVDHSRMIGSVTVMEPAAYEAWLGGSSTAPVAAVSGEQLFETKVCNTCHRSAVGALGPDLHGVFGSQVELEDGSVIEADENYLRESILDPGARQVKGFRQLMPTYQGQLSEEELVELILYIKSLGNEP